MNRYEVTIKFPTKDAFVQFIDNVGLIAGEMTLAVTKPLEEQAISEPPYKLRTRSSKVNDTIIASLQTGPLSAKQLKQGLEDAGLAPGSLSTGLAALQKSGQIARVSEGVYGLVHAYEAAAE
jgi:predicted Rossmann fold nucleotide-binding protein DprA/Smf involved in DNA uptake